MEFAQFEARKEFNGDVISALAAEIGMGQLTEVLRLVFILPALFFSAAPRFGL